MPDIDDRVKYSEAASGGALASSIDEQDLFALATADAESETGFISKVSRFLTMATKIVKGINWTSDLKTSSKNVLGAINEVNGVWKSTVLMSGFTGVVINDPAITTDSLIDVYTDHYGVNPTNITVTAGSLTLTFEAYPIDLYIKVRIL